MYEPHFRPPPRLTLLPLNAQASSMERKLVNQRGSVITISSTKWPGEYMMVSKFWDGEMHIMFISDMEREIEMLLGEGYVEVKE